MMSWKGDGEKMEEAEEGQKLVCLSLLMLLPEGTHKGNLTHTFASP